MPTRYAGHMARKNRRRLDRKNRPKLTIEPAPHGFGAGSALTSEERHRVLSRFGSMTHRGTTISFKPLLRDGLVEARTPEELVRATTEKLGRRRGERTN